MIPPKADAGEAMQANHEPATEAVSASDWWGAREGDDGDRPKRQRNDGQNLTYDDQRGRDPSYCSWMRMFQTYLNSAGSVPDV